MKVNEKRFIDSLDFVARHYEKDAFQATRTWKSLGVPLMPWWRRRAVAAAVACVVIGASAFVYNWLERSSEPAVPAPPTQEIVQPATPAFRSERIEFNDADIDEVVSKIEEVYGLTIENVPDADIRLTLSYEGTADELVSIINDMEHIDLVIKNSANR